MDHGKMLKRAQSLRRNMTEEEKQLWYRYLRTYPVRFSRQKVMGCYILDFYCAEAKLAVELDGSQHFNAEGEAYDARRTAFLQQYGVEVLRIPNDLVQRSFPAVCQTIDRAVKERLEQRR